MTFPEFQEMGCSYQNFQRFYFTCDGLKIWCVKAVILTKLRSANILHFCMKNDSNSFKTSSNLTRSPPNASLPVGGAGTSPRSLGAPGSRAPEHKRSLPGRQTLHPQARATTYRETHKEKQTCFITLYIISLKSHGALICGIQIEDHVYAFLSSVIALISIFSPWILL